MNRRTLLASASAAAMALGAGPAAAQALVHDPVSNAARIAEAGRAIQQAIQQVRVMEATWMAVSHATDVQGVAAALGGSARTHMPEAGAVTDLLAGSGGMWGAANRLLGLGRYADVGTETPWAREMQRRELVTANARAIAIAGLEAAQSSVASLTSLLDRITGSQDVAEVSAVNGALEVENQNIAHHKAQIDQVRLMLATEDRTERQRDEQMRYESARQQYESLNAVTGEFR